MNIFRKILQANCKHLPEDLIIKTIHYNSRTMTSTAIDNEIVCNYCGKVLVGKVDYKKFRDLIEMWETM